MKNQFVFSLLFLASLFACQNAENRQSADLQTQTEGEGAEKPVADGHNAANALDVDGTYQGMLPCADCEGIETVIELLAANKYRISQTYKGKSEEPVESTGSYTWNEEGNAITLEGEGAPNRYFVGENVLFKLDMEGNRISGDLADMYMLKKQ